MSGGSRPHSLSLVVVTRRTVIFDILTSERVSLSSMLSLDIRERKTEKFYLYSGLAIQPSTWLWCVRVNFVLHPLNLTECNRSQREKNVFYPWLARTIKNIYFFLPVYVRHEFIETASFSISLLSLFWSCKRCAYAVAGERASLRVSRGGTRAAPTRSHNIINTTCVRATWMETTIAEDRRGKSWMGKRAGEKTR